MNYCKTIPVKVCGITHKDNMFEIAKLKPEYMGFIFYNDSVRDVSANIKKFSLDKITEGINKVAVMVNKPLDEAQIIAGKYNFDYIQLHGDETPQYCNELRNAIPIIKTFSVWDKLPRNLEEYENCCNYFLFDTKTDKRGGSGISFDHKILNEYNGQTPFFLSGGITPGHAVYIKNIKHSLFHAVDINSRFEILPGIKDTSMLKRFFNEMGK